jgi:hypothetical protein
VDKVVLLAFTAALNLTLVTAINKLDYSPAVTVLVVVGFNLIMPDPARGAAAGVRDRPEAAPKVVDRAKAWAGVHWRTVAVSGLCVIGGSLVLKGIVGLA